jgi:hypothetical protein
LDHCSPFRGDYPVQCDSSLQVVNWQDATDTTIAKKEQVVAALHSVVADEVLVGEQDTAMINEKDMPKK